MVLSAAMAATLALESVSANIFCFKQIADHYSAFKLTPGTMPLQLVYSGKVDSAKEQQLQRLCAKVTSTVDLASARVKVRNASYVCKPHQSTGSACLVSHSEFLLMPAFPHDWVTYTPGPLG